MGKHLYRNGLERYIANSNIIKSKYREEMVLEMKKKKKYSKKQVGIRLKEFRLSQNQTQKQFSEHLFWDINSYRKTETGVTMLTTDRAQQLYNEYDMDITYVFTGEKMKPENMLKQVWISATQEERRELYNKILEYMKEII